MTTAEITKIATVHFAHQIQDMGTDYNRFNQVYKILKARHDALRRAHRQRGQQQQHGRLFSAPRTGASSLSYKGNPALDSVSTSDDASLKDAN